MKILITFSILSIFLYGCVQPTSVETDVDGNNKPDIISITADRLSIRVGTSTTITVTATDPDGDNLSYSWTVALGDIIGSGNQVRYTAAFCCVGINTINIVVKDSRGSAVKGSINVEVTL
jgi:Bacterial Ig domain